VGLSPTYLDVVSAYKEYTGKLVLLRAGPVDTRYKQFGLKMIQFKKVFRLGTLHNEPTGSYLAWKGVEMFEPSSVNDEVCTKRKGRICHHFANDVYLSTLLPGQPNWLTYILGRLHVVQLQV
jgi:hypothetical protein